MTRKRGKKDKPPRRAYSIPKRVSVLLLTILILAIPFVIYFTRYISNQTTYFTNQNFRELSGISEQVEGKIRQLRDVFASRAAYFVTLPADSPGPTFQELLQGTGLIVDHVPENRASNESRKIVSAQAVKLQMDTGGEDSVLGLILDVEPNDERERFRVHIELSELINPIVGRRTIENARGSDHEQGFDTVLIASLESDDKKGGPARDVTRVLFQSRSPELDIDSLDNLVKSDTPDKGLELKTLSDNSASADVRLADADYKIYSQPVELPLPTVGQSAKQSRWLVCGLVQLSHFRRQTWAFPYTLLITAAFLTVLIALSWPFLRLIFIGPKDRLRLADVYFIAFAFLVGTAILSFFALYGLTYSRSEYELDGQLKKLSQEIAGYTDSNQNFHPGNLHKEVNKISQELDELDKELRKPNMERRLRPAFETLEEAEAEKDPVQRRRKLAAITGYDQKYVLNHIKDSPYPYFRRAAWIDETGGMRIVWSINADTSPLTSSQVLSRDWFTKIMNGESRNLGDNLWLEPVTSKYTGKKTVVVSKRIYGTADSGKILGVAALDPQFMSLMNTVLPAGFGYRVIDDRGNDPGDENEDTPGKVVFQSSESQLIKESFYRECDNNHSLRSLVVGRASDFVDVNYKGEGHRLYVSPIKGFSNWSLIVFRNKQPLRTVYLEILTLAGFVFFVYASILLIGFTILYVVKTRTNERTEWIWPSDEMSHVYENTLYANIVLCVFSGAVIITLTNWPLLTILACSLFAFAGILVLLLRLRLSWVHRTGNSLKMNQLFGRTGGAYVWNVVVLLILTGVLPAIVFYKVAYNEEMKLFVKHAQFTLAQGLAEREKRINEQYSTQRTDPPNNPRPLENADEANGFVRKRVAENLDIYTDFFYETERKPWAEKRPQSPNSVLVFLNSVVPLFNETSIEMGGLTRGVAADMSYQWEEYAGRLAFHDIANTKSDSLHIVTPIQRFRPPLSWFGLVWLASFAVIFGLIYSSARLVVRKIFLLDLSERMSMPAIAETEVKQNLFVVQNLPGALENGLDGDKFFSIDLTREQLEIGWAEKVEARISNHTPSDKIIIYHFEHGIRNKLISDQKLQLLESLLAARKLIVIMSSLEPVAYSVDMSGRGSTGHSNGRSERWAHALSRFSKLYCFNTRSLITNPVADLETALASSSTVSQEKRDQVLELATLVCDECARVPCLQDLRTDIMQRLKAEELTWYQILRQIFERAELYYREVWYNCTDGERLTLMHLAEDRLLSPADPDIAQLVRKGLIVFDPDIQLMNETFKFFLLTRTASDSLQVKETQARKSSPWEAFKIPLFITVLAAIAFLFFTQKDLYGSSWTLITAMTTGIPAVFKVISFFQGDGGVQKIFSA